MNGTSVFLRPGRAAHLECARGLASLVVLFHHFALAFYPAAKASVAEGGLKFTPLYLFINGGGAVAFFFVLSGYLLTRPFYRRDSLDGLLHAMAKRLPRLWLPVAASLLLGALVFLEAGSPYERAAEAARSPWLASFGNAHFPAGVEPSLLDALRQSFCVFVRPYDFYYNSNLWTMGPEFYGSLLVFLLAGATVRLGGGRPDPTLAIQGAALQGAAALASVWLYPPFLPFMAGSCLAFLLSRRRGETVLPARATVALLGLGSLGFVAADWLLNTVGALLLMGALLGSPGLARRLSGRAAALLGALSFPLYLVHALVILSASSLVYAWLSEAGVPGLALGLATFAVTLLGSLLACLPFALLDAWWVPRSNRLVRRLLERALGPGGERRPAARRERPGCALSGPWPG